MPTVILPLRPQTHVRAVQSDAMLFRIPIDQLRPEGRKRRDRLQKYNDYKDALFNAALELGFTFPDEYFWVTYFIPIPASWKKWRRREGNLRPHRSKPDKDNLDKAFFDGLLKADQVIWDSRSTKIWLDHPTGYIQIVWGDDLQDH
jgi:Holliday junction resolvase RusA-like endonuclease